MIQGDAPAAGPTVAAVGTMPRRTPVGATYRRLRMAGLTAAEAGNLTAHLEGLRMTPHGWTLQEIERLLFVRSLVDDGRLRS